VPAVLQQGYREYAGDIKGACQAPEHNIELLLRAGRYQRPWQGIGFSAMGLTQIGNYEEKQWEAERTDSIWGWMLRSWHLCHS